MAASKTDVQKLVPKKAEPTSGVIINELMAANSKSAKDPQGNFDDWIELYIQRQAVDLGGMYLTDSELAPKKWKFPEGTQIAAGGYLVLWADEDAKAADGLHVSFKLSTTGRISSWSIAMIAATPSSTMCDSKNKPPMLPLVAIRAHQVSGYRW